MSTILCFITDMETVKQFPYSIEVNMIDYVLYIRNIDNQIEVELIRFTIRFSVIIQSDGVMKN